MSKEILEKQRLELWGKIEEFQNQHNDILQKMYKDISLNFSEQFTVTITEDRINFELTGHNWYDFNIQRQVNWGSLGEGKVRFGEATINCSSTSNADDKNLKKFVLMGEIARACMLDTQQWADLVGLMDKCWELKERDIKPIRDQIYDIENTQKILQQNEDIARFTKVFETGHIKLKERTKKHYGNGKHDYVVSDEFFWKVNPSGKTYQIQYIENRRINNYHDDNGNIQDAIYERVKCDFPKRVNKSDIEQLIKYEIKNIAE